MTESRFRKRGGKPQEHQQTALELQRGKHNEKEWGSILLNRDPRYKQDSSLLQKDWGFSMTSDGISLQPHMCQILILCCNLMMPGVYFVNHKEQKLHPIADINSDSETMKPFMEAQVASGPARRTFTAALGIAVGTQL